MDETRPVPSSVRALAQSVGMTPLDWAEHPDRIVIVFVEGPKMTFPLEQVTPHIQRVKEPESNMIDKTFRTIEKMRKTRPEADQEPLTAPPAASTPPLIDAPPIQSEPKKKKKKS